MSDFPNGCEACNLPAIISYQDGECLSKCRDDERP